MTTNDAVCFPKEANIWTTDVTVADVSLYSNCGGSFIIGGPDWSPSKAIKGTVLQRLYENVPAHKYIRYTFSFWANDGWDISNSGTGTYDHFQIQFDDLPLINGWGMDSNDFKVKLCGQSTKDVGGARVFGWIEHSSPSVLLTFISRMTSKSVEEGFGMRQIKLLFTNTTPTTSSYICGYTSNVPLHYQTVCVCPPGKYSLTLSSSGCTACHEDCASCSGLGPENCYECSYGRYFDGTECKKCDSACLDCFGPSANECIVCAAPGVIAFQGKCISDTRCTSQMIFDTCSSGNCLSPCLLEDRDSWKEDCFPPCPSGYISNLQSDCIRKYLRC